MNWKTKLKNLRAALVAAFAIMVCGCSAQQVNPLSPEEMPEGAIGGGEAAVYAVDPLVIGLVAVGVLAAVVIIAVLVAKNKNR